jgi:hypothetical protein
MLGVSRKQVGPRSLMMRHLANLDLPLGQLLMLGLCRPAAFHRRQQLRSTCWARAYTRIESAPARSRSMSIASRFTVMILLERELAV